MAFAARGSGERAAMSEMNVTPLVDVMLVLLIIFMVTAPVLAKKIPLDLPQPCLNCHQPSSIEPVRLDVTARGNLLWNGESIPESTLGPLLQIEAARSEQPLLQIAVAADADYQRFATVLAQVRNAKLEKIAVDGVR